MVISTMASKEARGVPSRASVDKLPLAKDIAEFQSTQDLLESRFAETVAHSVALRPGRPVVGIGWSEKFAK
jgi:hypothetical protein